MTCGVIEVLTLRDYGLSHLLRRLPVQEPHYVRMRPPGRAATDVTDATAATAATAALGRSSAAALGRCSAAALGRCSGAREAREAQHAGCARVEANREEITERRLPAEPQR